MCRSSIVSVLIVPSGIETRILDENEPLTDVLIVPSGIETEEDERCSRKICVLIVPSGIETFVVAIIFKF